MKRILPATLFCLITFCAGCGKTREGQIFIVTNGGQSVKLGLVTVTVYKQDYLDRYIKQALEKELPEMEKCNELIAKIHNDLEQRIHSSDEDDFDERLKPLAQLTEAKVKVIHQFFDNLDAQQALESTVTDGDGKFSIKNDDSHAVIVATATRQSGEFTDYYVWILPKEKWTPLYLSNDNQFPVFDLFKPADHYR